LVVVIGIISDVVLEAGQALASRPNFYDLGLGLEDPNVALRAALSL